jgi:hypothetical protein
MTRSLIICTPNQILFGWLKSRRMRKEYHVALIGQRKGAYKGLVWKPEGKSLLGWPRRMWVDNIKTDLQEVRWTFTVRIHLTRIGTRGGH